MAAVELTKTWQYSAWENLTGRRRVVAYLSGKPGWNSERVARELFTSANDVNRVRSGIRQQFNIKGTCDFGPFAQCAGLEIEQYERPLVITPELIMRVHALSERERTLIDALAADRSLDEAATLAFGYPVEPTSIIHVVQKKLGIESLTQLKQLVTVVNPANSLAESAATASPTA